MAMLDFGTVRYFNLVADEQENVYIYACSDVGRIFNGGFRTKGAVSIPVIPGTGNEGSDLQNCWELVSLTNLPVNIGGEQKKAFSQFQAHNFE